ncbi:SBBP repeat-containing protein [Flavihumibacter fluvii]|uniref:SBBP repeat-containing protein n=1 Tax=Flavihumibacter fluvii TaxID=2838157 RepID=UPI001BDF6E2C|nr:SBBP repeat-containing protein [Flavihumibacter fluvii]ULQ54676.1 SBBP repeat-containing protein [Flavihumibacter fluvii]
MKKMLFILFLAIGTVALHAQPLNFKWADQFKVLQAGTDKTSVVDVQGNVYVTGTFNGTVDFDPGPGVFSLTAPIDNGTIVGGDMFITKLSAGGELLWVKQITGKTCVTGGLSIAVDTKGNVYTTGTVYSTNGLPGAEVDFDPGPGKYNMKITSKSYDAFISKLDGCGNFIWVKQISGIGSDRAVGKSITIDAQDNIYLLGDFAGTNIDFDPGPNLFRLSTNVDVQRIVVCKLDAAGNFAWARQMEPILFGNTIFGAKGNSIAVDENGNSYITGIFVGEIDFDPGPQKTILSANTTYGNSYIVKLDTYGNLVWAKQAGKMTSSRVYGSSIAVDHGGNVYTAGNFNGTADFDPGPGEYNMSNSSITHQSIYIFKLDKKGEFIWARQMGDTSLSMDVAITLDPVGNVYAAGNFSGEIDIDPGPRIHPLRASGLRDVFVAKLDPGGDFLWAEKWGGKGNADAYGLSLGIDGGMNIITTGTFLHTIDFDPASPVVDLTSAGNSAIFVHKMSPCEQNTYSTITVTECSSFLLNCKQYTASGRYTQTLLNAAGCDSIITLNLTVVNPMDTVSVTACNAYNWHGRNFTESGYYTDTLKAVSGCDSIITLDLSVGKTTYTELDAKICIGQDFSGYSTSGSFTDTLVAVNGCDSIRTIHLVVFPKPVPELGPDRSLCVGDTIRLFPGQFDQYKWQDGTVSSGYVVQKSGLYSVEVKDSCGSGFDEILVGDGICDIYFPSAFSPNHDGKNDIFRLISAKQLDEFSLAVYNRWGQVVFESRDRNAGWDGRFLGKLADNGIYLWFCRFKEPGSADNTVMKGTVNLVR